MIKLVVTMVEAMDDSYIFAKSIHGLQFFCLQMERFQFAYNWLTQWSKTLVYILEDPSIELETVAMLSITKTPGKDPWTITYHPMNVIHGQLEMLRTFVDDPNSRFQVISDFLAEFLIPRLMVRTPITLIQKIIMQNVASKARAMLALQPIKQKDAETLDHKIAQKVHDCLGFPFQPNSNLLCLPVELMGFEFPSIAKINLTLSIDGLAQDLNHHIRPYQMMAQITLADWTCSMNECISPLETKTERNFLRFYRKIPVAWLEAQNGLQKLGINLWKTDLSCILTGEPHTEDQRKGRKITWENVVSFPKERGRRHKPQCKSDYFIVT